MKTMRYLHVAVESLLAHKLRSILTMLGIIIGVASIVLTIGFGRGAARSITEEIENQGTNLLTVNAGFGMNNLLTMADAKVLASSLLHPEIVTVVPEFSSHLARLVYGEASIELEITGTTAEYATIRNLQMAQGRFFTAEEVASQQRVIVLSITAAEELFKTGSPIGQTIRIQNELVQVIGVLKESSGVSLDFSSDVKAYVPIALAQKRLFETPRYRGEYTITAINIQVASHDLLKEAEYRIEKTLRLLHNLDADDANTFIIMNQARLLELADNISRTLTFFLGSIGVVSLLVGGIGIMNIMLVSVTERTREIGLRKALGAHNGDILLQFLMEALTLTTLGGAIGTMLSYGIGFFVKQIPELPLQLTIEFWVVLLALCVSLCCGFIFGIYPAIRATHLDPIEALRYE